MTKRIETLIRKLQEQHSLELSEYQEILDSENFDTNAKLRELAYNVRLRVFGNQVFYRGLIEISNYCKNDCKYCGIRRSNRACLRYRLSKEEILGCVDSGYEKGYRVFVMQGGEDPFFTDEVLIEIIKWVKEKYKDVLITLSLGERSYESYAALKAAGADRYLLRHETADKEHYDSLHEGMSFDNRIECLKNLKKLAYTTGCGFMVGSPGQSNEHIAKDLKFIEQFDPQMCGIGPFIPHDCTPYANEDAGSVDKTCSILSLIRLMKPKILLPATTALATLAEDGYQRGLAAGANVIMRNISPETAKTNYVLYNNKNVD